MQFEYTFERVAVRHDTKSYQEVIKSRAAEGWRLVQVLVEVPAAVPQEYIIVLERAAP